MFFYMIFAHDFPYLLGFLVYFLVGLFVCFSQRKKKSRISFFCSRQSFFNTTWRMAAATLLILPWYSFPDDCLNTSLAYSIKKISEWWYWNTLRNIALFDTFLSERDHFAFDHCFGFRIIFWRKLTAKSFELLEFYFINNEKLIDSLRVKSDQKYVISPLFLWLHSFIFIYPFHFFCCIFLSVPL